MVQGDFQYTVGEARIQKEHQGTGVKGDKSVVLKCPGYVVPTAIGGPPGYRVGLGGGAIYRGEARVQRECQNTEGTLWYRGNTRVQGECQGTVIDAMIQGSCCGTWRSFKYKGNVKV